MKIEIEINSKKTVCYQCNHARSQRHGHGQAISCDIFKKRLDWVNDRSLGRLKVCKDSEITARAEKRPQSK